jgi:hypothetical protein
LKEIKNGVSSKSGKNFGAVYLPPLPERLSGSKNDSVKIKQM